MRNRLSLVVSTIGLSLCVGSAARDTTVDLTTAGASGTINGALYQQNTSQPSGTGFIDSFLRIEKTGGGGAEQGYNTDFRPVEFDEKTDHNFTRSIRVSDVPTA